MLKRIIYYLFIYPHEKMAQLQLEDELHTRRLYDEQPIWKETGVTYEQFRRRLR